MSRPSSFISIRGFRLRGDNPDGGTDESYHPGCEHQMGVAVYGSTAIEIDSVQISDVYGDCLYVGGAGSPFVWSESVTFRDSFCRRTGRMGVSVVGGKNVVVRDVVFDDIAIHVFDIEPNHSEDGAEAVLFESNFVDTYAHAPDFTGYFFAANGTMDALVRDVAVRDNLVGQGTIAASVGDGLDYQGQRNRREISVAGNRSLVAGRGPILKFRHVDGLTVSGNVQPLRSGDLVSVADSTGVIIE